MVGGDQGQVWEVWLCVARSMWLLMLVASSAWILEVAVAVLLVTKKAASAFSAFSFFFSSMALYLSRGQHILNYTYNRSVGSLPRYLRT